MNRSRLGTTPSQTVGPYLSLGMGWLDGGEVVAEDVAGAITVKGRLLDGVGEPVPDGAIEVWQVSGFGRSLTDDAGRWRIRTVKPEPIPGPKARPRRPTWSSRSSPGDCSTGW